MVLKRLVDHHFIDTDTDDNIDFYGDVTTHNDFFIIKANIFVISVYDKTKNKLFDIYINRVFTCCGCFVRIDMDVYKINFTEQKLEHYFSIQEGETLLQYDEIFILFPGPFVLHEEGMYKINVPKGFKPVYPCGNYHYVCSEPSSGNIVVINYKIDRTVYKSSNVKIYYADDNYIVAFNKISFRWYVVAQGAEFPTLPMHFACGHEGIIYYLPETFGNEFYKLDLHEKCPIDPPK